MEIRKCCMWQGHCLQAMDPFQQQIRSRTIKSTSWKWSAVLLKYIKTFICLESSWPATTGDYGSIQGRYCYNVLGLHRYYWRHQLGWLLAWSITTIPTQLVSKGPTTNPKHSHRFRFCNYYVVILLCNNVVTLPTFQFWALLHHIVWKLTDYTFSL